MKITKSRLRQIIKEEISMLLKEGKADQFHTIIWRQGGQTKSPFSIQGSMHLYVKTWKHKDAVKLRGQDPADNNGLQLNITPFLKSPKSINIEVWDRREFDKGGEHLKFKKEIPFKLSYKGNIRDMSDDEEKQAYLEFLKVANPWIKKTQGMKF